MNKRKRWCYINMSIETMRQKRLVTVHVQVEK